MIGHFKKINDWASSDVMLLSRGNIKHFLVLAEVCSVKMEYEENTSQVCELYYCCLFPERSTFYFDLSLNAPVLEQ